jgi:glycine oxidase
VPSRSRYDVLVVGAGVVGLACAWRAAQRGLSVLAVDRAEAGAGASGVAAGMLAPVTEAEFGEEPLLRLNLASAELWPAFAAELAERSGLDTGYAQTGALIAAADRDDVEELRRLHAFQRSLGLEAEWLSGRECRRLEPRLSPRVAGGVLAPRDHAVDPRALLSALHEALVRQGGELVEGFDVAEVEVAGGRLEGARSASGERVAADSLVIAGGAWSGTLGNVSVRPVKGQILRLRQRPPDAKALVSRLVRTPRCYVVARTSGEVVIGATVEERGFDTTVTADGVHRLLEAAWEVLPDVAELELVEARAGLRPGSPDNAPVVGPGDADGLVWATGHYRNGILLAPITATAVAALVAGERPGIDLAPFAPERFAGVVA